MEDPNDRLGILLNKYAANIASGQEEDELFTLIENTIDPALESSLIAYLQTVQPQYDEARRQRILSALLKQVKPGGVYDRPQADTVSRSGPRVIQMFRNKTFRWVAAASVIIIASFIVILSLSKNDNGTKPAIAQTHDVPAPKDTRAVITLADGRKVYLDSAGNGVLAKENNVNILRNSEGEIQYMSPAGGGELNDSQNRKRPGVVYNTLFNPRGSKVISLTLSDGTKVWLNSESSLKYPIAFNDKTREVEITGEAYFEVKHNSKQPFKVHLPNGGVVEDIGTSFNINSYPDEDATKTTLIEGAVKVSAKLPGLSFSAVKLKPGQQAAINTFNLQLLTFNNVDLEETLAWKNGQFSFSRTNIVSIMKQIERWYDVQVVFADDVKSNDFTGGIARTENVSQVLKMLEKTGVMHFKIEGKRITVTK